MARKKSKIKMNVKAASAPTTIGAETAAASEDEWKVRDDADRVKRYAELTREPARHKAAVDHIRAEHDSVRELFGASEEPKRPVKNRKTSRTGSRK
jgi:hypothetical protein